MRHLGRAWTPVFYAGFVIELLGVAWALAATAQSVPLRLAPLILGYLIMVVAYWRARRAIRRWATPADPAVWARIGLRLLAIPDLDAEFGESEVERRTPKGRKESKKARR